MPIGDIPRGGYPLIVRYALRLPKSSFVIDGETVVLRRAGRLGADAATGVGALIAWMTPIAGWV